MIGTDQNAPPRCSTPWSCILMNFYLMVVGLLLAATTSLAGATYSPTYSQHNPAQHRQYQPPKPILDPSPDPNRPKRTDLYYLPPAKSTTELERLFDVKGYLDLPRQLYYINLNSDPPTVHASTIAQQYALDKPEIAEFNRIAFWNGLMIAHRWRYGSGRLEFYFGANMDLAAVTADPRSMPRLVLQMTLEYKRKPKSFKCKFRACEWKRLGPIEQPLTGANDPSNPSDALVFRFHHVRQRDWMGLPFVLFKYGTATALLHIMRTLTNGKHQVNCARYDYQLRFKIWSPETGLAIFQQLLHLTSSAFWPS